jgi:hypothetical protein
MFEELLDVFGFDKTVEVLGIIGACLGGLFGAYYGLSNYGILAGFFLAIAGIIAGGVAGGIVAAFFTVGIMIAIVVVPIALLIALVVYAFSKPQPARSGFIMGVHFTNEQLDTGHKPLISNNFVMGEKVSGVSMD